MSEFAKLAGQLTPEIVRSFKQAIETGRWPDGKPLSAQQRELVTQSIIIYEHNHFDAENRTGAIEDQCASKSSGAALKDVPQAITIK